MVFRAELDQTKWTGLAVCIGIGLLDVLLFFTMLSRPVDWTKFVLLLLLLLSVPLLVHLIYRTWSLFSLEYWVDRNAVTVSWAGIQHSFPLYKINQIIQGDIQDIQAPKWQHWPANHIRTGQTLSMRKLRHYATQPLHECLLLDMEDTVVAISPAETEKFLEIIQERYEIGPAVDVSDVELPAARIQRAWWALSNLEPVGVILLTMGIVGALVLFGFLMVRFPSLPSDLVMRYNADGSPELIRAKTRLFLIPAIGLMAWFINGFWGGLLAIRNHLVGAYMLWGGAVIVQIVSFFALLTLMA